MENNKYWFFGSKLNTALLLILIICMVIAIKIMLRNEQAYFPFSNNTEQVKQTKRDIVDTYTYTNYGFSIELPKGFEPREYPSDEGSIIIFLPEGDITYISDVSKWDSKKGRLEGYIYNDDKKFGDMVFKIYEYKGETDAHTLYLFKQGNVAYILSDENIIKTFKFVGLPQIEGNKNDLVSFSVVPNSKVSGVLNYEGSVKGAYFFEANIGINILDIKGNYLKRDHANSTTDWMTVEPVLFKGSIDLSGLPKGPAYFEIHNDNASGLPEKDKFIWIPIVIE
jgi:hypothetical protein